MMNEILPVFLENSFAFPLTGVRLILRLCSSVGLGVGSPWKIKDFYMRKKGIIILAVLLGGLAGVTLWYSFAYDPQLDGRSGATSLSGSKKIELPPEGDDYQVLGERSGVRGVVVQYDDQVIRGGEPYKKSAAKTLRSLGIQTIISIVPTDVERAFCKKQGFELVEIPFDKTTGVSSNDVARLQKTIQTGVGPFYIHCNGGSHRGGTLSAAYRLTVLGWPFEKVIAEFDQLGGDPIADQNLIESLRRCVP